MLNNLPIPAFVKNHKWKIAVVLVVLIGLIATFTGNGGTRQGFNGGAYGGESDEAYSSGNYIGMGRATTDMVMPEMASVEEGKMASLGFTTSDTMYPMPPIYDDGTAAYDPTMERKLMKNGSLSLIVTDIQAARTKVEQSAESFGGFVSSVSFNEYEQFDYARNNQKIQTRSAYIVVKVPVEHFTHAMQTFKDGALKVSSENSSADDVTEEYADLESQIKNKKAEEEQYRVLLARATKVEDILQVTQYINQARQQIEQLEGRLNYMKNNVQLSTITVNLTSEEDVSVFGVVWSPWDQIKDSFTNLIAGLVNFVNHIIAFVFFIPIIILYGLGYGVVAAAVLFIIYKVSMFVYKKVKRQS